MPDSYTHPNAARSYARPSVKPIQPADATATQKPSVPSAPSESAMIEAKGYKAHPAIEPHSQAAIDHRDSVLADPFNVLHYGQPAVDQAVHDSANQAQNIEVMNESPASGAGTFTAKPAGKARFPNLGK